MTRQIFLQMIIFFVACAWDHKLKDQISIHLSTRALNYAMRLSTFIESLLISIPRVKIFQFFLRVFTLNRPTTSQKFKL